MKKGILLVIAIVGMLSIPLVSGIRETYTKDEYLSKVPNFDKIDTTGMSVYPGGDWNTLPMGGVWWLYSAPTDSSEASDMVRQTTSILSGGTMLIYTYRGPVVGTSDDGYIAVSWDATGKPIDCIGYDWDEGWLFTYVYKDIADHSLEDLSLKETGQINTIAALAVIFAAIGVACVVVYIKKK